MSEPRAAFVEAMRDITAIVTDRGYEMGEMRLAMLRAACEAFADHGCDQAQEYATSNVCSKHADCRAAIIKEVMGE